MTPTTRLFMAGLAALCIGAPAFAQNATPPSRDPAALQKAAYNVDKFVAGLYKRKKLSVPGVVDDATFLRRSFLVSAGRIPTLDFNHAADAGRLHSDLRGNSLCGAHAWRQQCMPVARPSR